MSDHKRSRPRRSEDGGWVDFGEARFLAEDEERELSVRVQEGDFEARDQLVLANLRLVASIARSYVRLGVPFADLISEGNLGLIKAAETFDPGRDVRFATHAGYWIRQSIYLALDARRLIRVPHHAVGAIRRWRRKEDELTEALGFRPVYTETARALGLSRTKLKSLRMALIANQPVEHLGELQIVC